MLSVRIDEPLRSVLPHLMDHFRSEGWWGDETFSTSAMDWAEKDPDHAMIRDDTTTLTRAQLLDRAGRFATALEALGAGRGSVVGLQLPNCADYAVANIGCELAGSMWVNLSPGYRHHEMLEILQHLNADVLVVETMSRGFDMRPLVDEVASSVPSLTTIVGRGASVPNSWLTFQSMVSHVRENGHGYHTRLGADDIYSIVLSSGTTSARPKEALRSINSMFSALKIMNRSFGIGPDDRLLCLAPQSGGAGYSYSVAIPALTGCRVDVTELPIGPELLSRIADVRPTVLVAVPTQMGRLLDEATDRSMWSALRLIVNSGAPLLGEVAARAEEQCGCPILSVYGATDGMVPVITATEAPPHIRQSRVGRVMDGHSVRIVDEDGSELPVGTVGEICGFGPGMAFGYVDNPQEMTRAWDADGWWHSGDLGVMDEDGYLRVVGRKKEMILRGGVNISPLEIEELLNQHPLIEEAVVVAMPHPELLEQACAFVVLRPGAHLVLSELVAFISARGLAKYKLPERLELRDEIPRTNMQKIDRITLGREIAMIRAVEEAASEPD
jgi:acyl-CoA synthetase (AMP-forming)/AMP-acid ligase II